jgi:hypothetical protein
MAYILILFMRLQTLFRMAGATALLSLAGATLPRALGATTGGIGPSAPGGFKATDGTWNHGIKVVWKAVFDGNYYQLYRSLTPNFAQATTRLRTSSNVLKDFRTTPGLAYYYWINAVAVREVDGKHVDFSHCLQWPSADDRLGAHGLPAGQMPLVQKLQPDEKHRHPRPQDQRGPHQHLGD